MIKAKITKNIIRKNQNPLGIGMKQIVITVIAAALGITLYFLLHKYLNTELLMSLIFIILAAIIGFGCLNIQGMTLFDYMISVFKGVDVRPYKEEGVFSKHEPVQKK